MTERDLRAIKPGTPLPWHTWILREFLLRPGSFYSRAEALAHMALPKEKR